ncbi:hypothetical protein F5X96DRAFT_671051 [Biscogniauxia mediterranea]|nr:hypothetical protein F5X96DRAFT_671051 [Biscogniauxia mediterranea]
MGHEDPDSGDGKATWLEDSVSSMWILGGFLLMMVSVTAPEPHALSWIIARLAARPGSW